MTLGVLSIKWQLGVKSVESGQFGVSGSNRGYVAAIKQNGHGDRVSICICPAV